MERLRAKLAQKKGANDVKVSDTIASLSDNEKEMKEQADMAKEDTPCPGKSPSKSPFAKLRLPKAKRYTPPTAAVPAAQ